MRAVSETRYYKALAKLYEKCAQLSSQLDIYEDDHPRMPLSEDSEQLELPQIRTKKVSKKIAARIPTKTEEGSSELRNNRYVNKDKRYPTRRIRKSQVHHSPDMSEQPSDAS